MKRVSTPLLGLLVAMVVFFAIWLVALKPSSSGTSGNPGVGQYQSAVNAAKAAAASQNAAAAAAGNTLAPSTSSRSAGGAKSATSGSSSAAAAGKGTTASAGKPATATTAKTAAAAKSPATAPAKNAVAVKPAVTAPGKPSSAAATTATTTTPTQRLNVVDRALADHRVLALLFYNPAAPDDQAVRRELAAVPSRRGLVVKLAVPLAEMANYPVVTTQVQIESSPTLVLVDRGAQAFSLVGFEDGFAVAHWVDDALSLR